MSILALCVLSNLALVVCFKLFPRFGVDTLGAIVLNYWISTGLGSAMAGYIPLLQHPPTSTPWTAPAIILGAIFVIGFTTIGLSIRYAGMTITTTMQKMSLLISVSYALIVYHEPAGLGKVTGILCAMLAIVMVTYRKASGKSDLTKVLPYLLLPLGALVFSGAIESILYYVQIESLAIDGDIAFTTYAFAIAALIGTVLLGVRMLRGSYMITWRDIGGGIVLGTPNFFSIYLILVLLNRGFPGSVLYPVLNILILVLSALIGLVLFREKLSRLNLTGLLVALAAILLVSLSQ